MSTKNHISGAATVRRRCLDASGCGQLGKSYALRYNVPIPLHLAGGLNLQLS